MNSKESITGQTKDAGFQIGVRQTFPVSPEKAWEFLFSDDGIRLWLGHLVSCDLSIDQEYLTQEGISGKIKVLISLSHIRLTWKKQGWQNTSTLQIRVIPAKTGTTISFHQEKLSDGDQRGEMKKYWEAILSQMADSID